MSTRLVVDNQNELQELRITNNPPQHPAVRVAATILSYIFHPVFIPLYVTLFLVYIHPYLFAGFTGKGKLLVFLQAILMYSFFPIVTSLLLKGLRFIESIRMEKQKDRIIPLVICGIWYFWIWYVWNNLPGYPKEIVMFAMATFLASSIALMMNIYIKVSLHAISTGVLTAFMLKLAFSQDLSFGLYITATLLIAGIVCTARFIASDHTQKEVYGGFFAGVAALLISVPVTNWLY
jgi:hypothetical protein